jgi:hypothetical protein
MTPMFGSIVQKGKFAACALAFVKALKIVDLPTFGIPTTPHLRPILVSFLYGYSIKVANIKFILWLAFIIF